LVTLIAAFKTSYCKANRHIKWEHDGEHNKHAIQ
jgi:hypothetical protein